MKKNNWNLGFYILLISVLVGCDVFLLALVLGGEVLLCTILTAFYFTGLYLSHFYDICVEVIESNGEIRFKGAWQNWQNHIIHKCSTRNKKARYKTVENLQSDLKEFT